MLEFGRRLGFDLETLDGTRRSQMTVSDHLQRHDPIQAELARAVDHTHAATSQFLDQFVVATSAELGWQVFHMPTQVGSYNDSVGPEAYLIAGERMQAGFVYFL